MRAANWYWHITTHWLCVDSVQAPTCSLWLRSLKFVFLWIFSSELKKSLQLLSRKINLNNFHKFRNAQISKSVPAWSLGRSLNFQDPIFFSKRKAVFYERFVDSYFIQTSKILNPCETVYPMFVNQRVFSDQTCDINYAIRQRISSWYHNLWQHLYHCPWSSDL